MLSEIERKELYELKHDSDALKLKIYNETSELENVDYSIACLQKWKKGRWVGFACMLIVTAACFAVEFFYLTIYENSVGEKITSKAAVIEFAVSSTAIAFFTSVLMGVSIFVIIIGIRVVLEVGNSRFSRNMARNMGVKNYYNWIEDSLEKQNELMDRIDAIQLLKVE